MRIGMVTAVYEPVVNGVTRMIRLYKDHLERLGHEVTIFTLGDSSEEDRATGVIRSPAIPIGAQGYRLGVRYIREARDKAREMDILHCHHFVFGLDFAHRYGNCPVTFTNHTRHDLYTSVYLPVPQQAADVLMRQIWPEYTRMADAVIVPSASVYKILRQFGVVQPISIIPNGVDLQRFHEPSEPWHRCELEIPETALLAIYTGRLSEEKNISSLIDQLAVALDIVPDIHLLLVGDGPARANLEAQTQGLGIADRVHFFGSARHESVPGLLAAADLYVTASVSEVHPLAVIEAMAAGLPVVASRSPGIVDTVENGRTGFLTTDPAKGLAAALLPLATNSDLRRKMGLRARDASRAYDIQSTVFATLDLYNALRLKRPDLTREQRHGRWYRPYERFKPKLRDIVNRFLLGEARQGIRGPDNGR